MNMEKQVDQIVQEIRNCLKLGVFPRCEMPIARSKSAVQNAIGLLRGRGEIIAMRTDGCSQYFYRLPSVGETLPLSEDMRRVLDLIDENGSLSGSEIKRKLRGGADSSIGDIVAGLVARKRIRFVDGRWMPGEPEFRELPAVEEKGGDHVSKPGWFAEAYNK